MVGVFGTMAADVLHVGFGVPYFASSTLYGVALAAVFVTWQKTEKTLSIHSIDRRSREAFYWAAVVRHLRSGYRRRRPDRVDLPPGVLLSAVLFAARDRDPRRRLLAIPLERDLRLLVCLCRHPAAGRLVCRLGGQAHHQQRSRMGRWTDRLGAHGRHLLPGQFPGRHASRRPG